MPELLISLGAVVLLIALWLFLIAAKNDKRMDKYKNINYAHRGLHGTHDIYPDAAPENSLKAFSRAVECGYGIELDVRQTKDGKLIIFHDDTLKRAAGQDKRLSDMTYDELSEITLFGTDEKIPLFAEVLAFVNGKVPLLVEIKDDGYKDTPVKTMEMLENYIGDYIVESFNPLILGKVKEASPEALRGFLCEHLTLNEEYKAFKYRIVQRNLLNFIARPHFIAGNFKNFPLFPCGVIKALFKPAMMAWTVRSEEEEAEARKKGFTGMIFEGYLPKIDK